MRLYAKSTVVPVAVFMAAAIFADLRRSSADECAPRLVTVVEGCGPAGVGCECPGTGFYTCPTTCRTGGCPSMVPVLGGGPGSVNGVPMVLKCSAAFTYGVAACPGTPCGCIFTGCPGSGCPGPYVTYACQNVIPDFVDNCGSLGT